MIVHKEDKEDNWSQIFVDMVVQVGVRLSCLLSDLLKEHGHQLIFDQLQLALTHIQNEVTMHIQAQSTYQMVAFDDTHDTGKEESMGKSRVDSDMETLADSRVGILRHFCYKPDRLQQTWHS